MTEQPETHGADRHQSDVLQPLPLLDDVVSTVASVDAAINQLAAVKASLMATAFRLADDQADMTSAETRELSHRAVAAEIAAVLRLSDRTVQRHMGESDRLVRDFPALAASFGAGRVSLAHVRIILDAGVPIEDAGMRAQFAEAMVPFAEAESPNRLRSIANEMAERFRDTSLSDRHTRARTKRRVWLKDEGDGMAMLGVLAPAALVHGIFDRLSRMAHVVKTENARHAKELRDRDGEGGGNGDEEVLVDERGMDALRADLLADLLLTGVPRGHDSGDGLLGEIQARVEVTVPVLSLIDAVRAAGLFDTAVRIPGRRQGAGLPAASLAGGCPIDPQTARILAGGAPGWDRVMTDPLTGAMLAVDRYRPGAELRRHLRARDRRCRFPGCGLVARKCDMDHTIDAALGGATEESNLACFCRRHHVLKHHTPWTVRQAGGGVMAWTSPTGRTFVDRPPGVPGAVIFTDSSRDARDDVLAPF